MKNPSHLPECSRRPRGLAFLSSVIRVAILNAQSPAFQWARSIGGFSEDIGNTIVADGSGNTYVTGSFFSQGEVDFDPGVGTHTLTGPGMFITKLDASGNFVWAKGIAAYCNFNYPRPQSYGQFPAIH